MQRYFVNPEQIQEGRVVITGDDAHHIIRVMRGKPGQTFIVCDGSGTDVLAELTELHKDSVTANIVETIPYNREPKVNVWIFQGLPKGDKLETVIQKGTELGAARFIPFQSARTVVQIDERKEGKKVERWGKIAKEAAEQAHRSRIPVVEAPLGWKAALKEAASADAAMICFEHEQGLGLRELLQGLDWGSVATIAVLIGPEGGFTDAEVEEAAAAGCRPITLGKRILRTETAALAALSCIHYETGEMGG
ncbi:16S rRNA (uracil(1498)-N(3))-methyltransferase [Paenibacillus turpanensis]|uniref:16S rRNA (uracil(1498)-N(3))-methyltransferase n=1 Tax=Paenibacillus turpanensis TaxID=2689078 RepID=UPI00140D98D2|nr:16S rRNA (uracil(1498)-N(3))-methyltransferase [Paenibacillus turpanensis]